MSSLRVLRNERGIALITTMLVAFAVSAIAIAAVMMTLNASLIAKNSERAAIVDAAALSGVEEARSRINGNRALYPTVGFTTLETDATVRNASNAAIPKVTRSTYIGPSGNTTGQYGIVGSIISVARDSFGNRAARRLEVNQESFSRFSYFTDIEEDTLGTTLSFLNNDQVRGPVHTNDTIRIASSGATFFDRVTSYRSTMIGQANGTFTIAPQLSVPRIPLPTVTDLAKLDSLATIGSARFTGSTAGDAGEARTRVQFITIDLTAEGFGVQGFFRVYQAGTFIANPEDFVSASLPTAAGNLRISPNCGDVAGGVFLSALRHSPVPAVGNPHRHNATAATNQELSLQQATSVCHLGGDSILTTVSPNATWPTNTAAQVDQGQWVQAPAAIRTALAGLGTVITNRRDKDHIFPLSRNWNPNFKGVIYVAGKVMVDGVIRGRVTVAASGNIIFGNDVTYWQGTARDCTTGDIAGYFSGQSIIVSNNAINAPQTVNTNASLVAGPAGTLRDYDDTDAETIYGFFLTLKTFGAEEYGVGSEDDQVCTNGTTSTVGRGCLNTFGGIIQRNRGAVTQTTGGGGTGYSKRYQYDSCGATDPPPYYPTTGVFVKNRYYEMDPTRLSIAGWYAANQN